MVLQVCPCSKLAHGVRRIFAQTTTRGFIAVWTFSGFDGGTEAAEWFKTLHVQLKVNCL